MVKRKVWETLKLNNNNISKTINIFKKKLGKQQNSKKINNKDLKK